MVVADEFINYAHLTSLSRELATQRAAVTTERLLSVCESVNPATTKSELVAFLRAHPSFHGPPVQQRWELGRLGSPIIDVGATGADWALAVSM